MIAWDSPVQFLKGVGPVRARAMTRLGIDTVGDLLRHSPRTYLDRTDVTPIRKAVPGTEVTLTGQVLTAGERRAVRLVRLMSVGRQQVGSFRAGRRRDRQAGHQGDEPGQRPSAHAARTRPPSDGRVDMLHLIGPILQLS